MEHIEVLEQNCAVVGRQPRLSPSTDIYYISDSPVEDMSIKTKKDDRPFKCNICGNRFRQQGHLKQHIRIHTNDRPYQCSHCDKAFKQKSQLNQHERIHTGEKPYKCPLCEKAFPQAGQLYGHKKTHGLDPKVNKDQSTQIKTAIKKRGRKRRSKETHTVENSTSPVVLSPPPVVYLMESLRTLPTVDNENPSAASLRLNVHSESDNVNSGTIKSSFRFMITQKSKPCHRENVKENETTTVNLNSVPSHLKENA